MSDMLPEIPGGWTITPITIAGHEIRLHRPADPDLLLDSASDDNIPFWAYLWPTAYDMAGWILQSAPRPQGPVLEIGCGIGLAGLAGLAAGWEIVFNDHQPPAIELALRNARENDWPNVTGYVLDWRDPPPEQYTTILGCEVTYERADHQNLLNFLEAALQPQGTVWLADANRAVTEDFIAAARDRNWSIEREELSPVDFPDRPQLTSVLWRLRR